MTRSLSLRASAPPRETFCNTSAAIAFLCALLVPCLAFAEPSVAVVSGADSKPSAIETRGLPQERLAALAELQPDDPKWQQVLAIYVASAGDDETLPPMLGAYRLHGETIRFTPRYPFRPGLTYRAVLTAAGATRIVKEITIPPAPRGEPTRVVAIYPTAAVLPENQLRFYIHFSAPMARGEAFEHVKLLGPGGQADPRAFFEVGEELWDASQQRLTVFFDPGRIKKGLSPREEHGPVLVAGQKYVLSIDKHWRDAAGHPLAAPFEKRFTAGPSVETAIDPKAWRINPPPAGTRDPLVIEFPFPLDHALARRTIAVESPGGQRITGEVRISNQERRWQFHPASPWPAGNYSLSIDTTLEDTAGNRINRPFEVDVFDRIDKNLAPETVRVPFTIPATAQK